jgi:zinc transporter ZupT
MNQVASRALLLTGGLVVLVAALSAIFVSFDSAGVRGIAIGVALGIANLVAGLFFTRRSLHKNMTRVTGTLLGGFSIRLVVLVALFFVFQQTSTIDAPAFALSFVVLFFVYLAAEIVMIERAQPSRTA